MKVRQLIARLQRVDPDMIVTTAGAEFGLVALELLHEIKVIPIRITEHNDSQYRLARPIDVARHTTVLCCGPSDPSLVGWGEDPEEWPDSETFDEVQCRIRRDCKRTRENCVRQRLVMARQMESIRSIRERLDSTLVV